MADGKDIIFYGEASLDLLSLSVCLPWLDASCGTNVHNSLILARSRVDAIIAVTTSRELISCSKRGFNDTRVKFREADATTLPFGTDAFDSEVMALANHYVPDRTRAIAELCRVVRPSGWVFVYVWDGTGHEHPQQPLIDTQKALRIGAREPGQIQSTGPPAVLINTVGLDEIETRSIEIRLIYTIFGEFLFFRTAQAARNQAGPDAERVKACIQENLGQERMAPISCLTRANAALGRLPG